MPTLQLRKLLLCHVHSTGKEYSKADSRYATRDDFIISMEAVTAFVEGPACLLIVWAMLKLKPWRFTAILLVSLGQLYGDVLYFGTCAHGGKILGEVCCEFVSRSPMLLSAALPAGAGLASAVPGRVTAAANSDTTQKC